MSVWASRFEAMGFLENLLNRYAPRTPGKPVFAVIDAETTGFNKRYDRIIELAAVHADAYFNPVNSWHTLLNPDTNAVSTTRGHPRPPRHSTLLWGLLVAKRAEHPGFHVIGVMTVKCPLTGVVSDQVGNHGFTVAEKDGVLA